MDQSIKNYSWFLTQKTKIFFRSNEFKNKINYVKASIYSILSGIILSSIIIIGVNGVNPLLFFKHVFKLAFHPLLQDQTLTYWAIYIIAGLSVAIGFKAGLFNIGVSGQMLLAGSMTIVLGLKNPEISQVVGIISALLISILMGSLLASIVGVLKAFFNIHEVVSTILLNWIVWYTMKWMFMNPSFGFWDVNRNVIYDIAVNTNNFNLMINGQTWIIAFIIAMILVLLTIFVMNYTVLGFYIKAVAKSNNALLYAGINTKIYIIISMAISGGFAGILGMLYYMIQSTIIQFNVDVLPIVGFDAIAIALVAFTNGLAIIPISLLWAIIKTAVIQVTQLTDFQMSKQMAQLIFGIIIYMNSISNIFIYFKPISCIKRFWIIYNNSDIKKQYQDYHKLINKIQREIKIINIEYHKKNKKLKLENTNKEDIKKYRYEINNQLTNLVEKINNTKIEAKLFIKQYYKILLNKGKKEIRIIYNNEMFVLMVNAIANYVRANVKYKSEKQEINLAKFHYNENINKIKIKLCQEIYKIKNQYKQDKQDLLKKKIEKKTKRNNLIKQCNEEIKDLKKIYYQVFEELCKLYVDEPKLLKCEEKKAVYEIQIKIKKLKEKYCKLLKELDV